MKATKHTWLYAVCDNYGEQYTVVSVRAQITAKMYRLEDRVRAFGYASVLPHGDPLASTTPEQAWERAKAKAMSKRTRLEEQLKQAEEENVAVAMAQANWKRSKS